jgi:hypothetical protein
MSTHLGRCNDISVGSVVEFTIVVMLCYETEFNLRMRPKHIAAGAHRDRFSVSCRHGAGMSKAQLTLAGRVTGTRQQNSDSDMLSQMSDDQYGSCD